MGQDSNKWSKTVFRARGLPSDVKTLEDVASLLSLRLGDVPRDSIRVYSLATTLDFTLNLWEYPRTKMATVMFQTLPSLIQNSPGEQQWSVPAQGPQNFDDVILDTHFMGMTPLNDVDFNHLFDCIAISGLASHPFGSWQPKGGDKMFMWIRDTLPKDLPGVRAVIYGYDTKLDSSHSFQTIPDLAQALISQLQTYGWSLPSAKPVVFLAHSLGGLVLREAMVQLDNSSNKEYKGLLQLARGAVFFGVPNLALVEDISRNSNYLHQLNDLFSKSSFQNRLKFFWAYETSKSPTSLKTTDGKPDRNGTSAILVSRDSATCRFIETNPSITFPIDETHSEMVKFTKGSQYYHIVISKLSSILALPQTGRYNKDHDPRSILSLPLTEGYNIGHGLGSTDESKLSAHGNQSKKNLEAELDMFKRTIGLTEAEENEFEATSFDSLQDFIRTLQQEQERDGCMMYMKRLEPFLVSMKEYVEAVKDADVFVNISDIIHYLWGPVKYILRFAQSFPEAFHSVLDAYQHIGEQAPACLSFQQLFTSKPYMRDILVMLYKDILGFHKDTIRYFKRRHWQGLFQASWRDFATSIKHTGENLRRHRTLMESGASIADFEAIQHSRQAASNAFEKHIKDQDNLHRQTVKAWLCPFSCESQHRSHIEKRSVCKDPGRWLLNHPRFQDWLNPDYCLEPLLWLNGIPGAGKTILASVVVDETRLIPASTLAFFYCKHDDEMRNSFIAVARSILAQILSQNSHLLPYFHEKAYLSNGTVLSSTDIADEMLETTLNSCERTYLIIDGLDECGQTERTKISNRFLRITQALAVADVDPIRCLFVSQDDGTARKTLGGLPTIKITTENKDDIKNFANVWHEKIEAKFGKLRSNDTYIANIISARARGMFIFAEVLAKYLESQLSRAALLEELNPAKLPVKLDDVYERILGRILDSRSEENANKLRLILGWIVWAKRPLRWREIQGAISIDMEQQHFDYDKKLADSPKELFASLVELESDGTVQLVHETAREYLDRIKFVQTSDVDHSLSLLSLAYLAFPEVDKERSDDDIAADLRRGIYAFYDYASACWAVHLQAGISSSDQGDRFSLLLETLEPFIELHWSSTPKSLKVSAKVQASLYLVNAKAPPEFYNRISQAVEWSRKQLGPHCVGPTEDEALDLWQVTRKIRSVLEDLHIRSLPETEVQILRQFYGSNWFKCPRISCHYYHQGFSTADKRKNHVDRHERPFLCVFDGCQMKLFGCPTEDELKKHVLNWHGIDAFDGKEYPAPPKSQGPSTAKNPATFRCPSCPNKWFTRKANLDSHLRTHNNIRPYNCGVCGETFTRKSDCDRHEKGHGDKKFTCFGRLNDGSSWGCKSSFGRADKLADHIKSKAGQKCIRPLVLQKLQESGEGAGGENMLSDELGTNADALLAAGKLLPSFGEFLRICGLDKSAIN